uniref:Uncharacterized protein n=1 Tax=Magallana gigas TaxID=29159 RepID=A0A8W8NYS7_MAGGI
MPFKFLWGIPNKKATSSGMKAGVNKKDEMYNMLVDDFVKKNFSFAKCTANTDGSYFIQCEVNFGYEF